VTRARAFWICVALPTMAAGAYLAVRARAAHAFPESEIRDYESLAEETAPFEVPQGTMPYRTGRVVLVRPATWQVYRIGTLLSTQIPAELSRKKEFEVDPPRIDDSWYELEPALRAGSPEEAATVILCDYRRLILRPYMGTADLYGPDRNYRLAVVLKVYDRRQRAPIGEALLAEPGLEGDEPALGTFTGDPAEIAAFVAKMPVRN